MSVSEIEVDPAFIETSVFVTNVSPNADEAALRSFFGYCGKVHSCAIGPDPQSTDGAQCAVVAFENKSAFRTALMLSNAQIVDRAIVVSAFVQGEASPAPVSAPGSASPAAKATGAIPPVPSSPSPTTLPPISQRVDPAASADEDVSLEEQAGKSKTAIMAELCAAGYVLGEGTIEKARAFDERNFNVKLQAQILAEKAKANLYALDDAYQISTKVEGAVEAVKPHLAKAGAVINQTGAAINQATATGYEKAMQNPNFAAGMNIFANIGNTITTSAGAFRVATLDEIEKQQASSRPQEVEGPEEVAFGAGGEEEAAQASVGGGAEVTEKKT